MRIAFSGAACTGKTTTIQQFLKKWPAYRVVKSEYRDVVKNTDKHSKNADANTQKKILDILCSDIKPYTLHDKVVYDRCPLDNLVYSMWANDKGNEGFNKNFMVETIKAVKESMRHLDIIFVCFRDLMPPVIEKKDTRESDPTFISETNNIFRALYKMTQKQGKEIPFFLPKDDSPALIELHGNTEERLAQIALYVTPEGDCFGEDQSLVNIDELTKMKTVLSEQQEIFKEESKTKPTIIKPT
jgi:hypothetical protein